MAIEKAFAIHATPHNIYAALERDLESALQHAGETYAVLGRERDRALDLRVTIGGVPCHLSYRLEEKPEYTEVAAVLQPYGWKYAAFKIMTLGMREQNFAVALVEGLANLKAAVEDDDEPAAEEEANRQGEGPS